MKQRSKFSQEQQQNAAGEIRQQAVPEFATSDELLRFDASQTAVPPQIAERLKQSAAGPPPPPRPWWKKLFGPR